MNRPIVKSALSILAGMAFIWSLSYISNAAGRTEYLRNSENLQTKSLFFSIRLLRAFAISALIYFVVYYFHLTLILQRSRTENERLKKENLEAQLAFLKQQISPHFLFNSLNTLSSLSHEESVKEYALKLSDVYRHVLHYQEHADVKVEDEIAFIRSYIYILETRFEEGIKINIKVGSDKLKNKILPLALQLLVENVVKHNRFSYNKPLLIDIYDTSEGIVVENIYRPKISSEKNKGIGLSNLSKRYKLTAGKDIRVAQGENKFKVEIPFL